MKLTLTDLDALRIVRALEAEAELGQASRSLAHHAEARECVRLAVLILGEIRAQRAGRHTDGEGSADPSHAPAANFRNKIGNETGSKSGPGKT